MPQSFKSTGKFWYSGGKKGLSLKSMINKFSYHYWSLLSSPCLLYKTIWKIPVQNDIKSEKATIENMCLTDIKILDLNRIVILGISRCWKKLGKFWFAFFASEKL